MSALPERTVRCPRCGYDQRGNVAAWRDACPLQSTCTECGLTYSCAEVLRPEKFEPQWCVEFCEARPMPFARSCCATFMRSFLPWRFWSRLKMSHRIQSRRIALYVLLLATPLLVLYIAAQTTIALYAHTLLQMQLAQWSARDAYILGFEPGTITLPPAEIQQYQVWHGDRWEEVAERVIVQMEADRPGAEYRRDNPPRIRGSAFLAVLEAIFLPAARSSYLAIENPLFRTQYPSPSELTQVWPVLIQSVTFRIMGGTPGGGGVWATRGWPEAARLAVLGIACGISLALMFPLSLALLPISRRKAKIRWAHIARITAYGLYIPSATITLVALLLVLAFVLAVLRISVPFIDSALAILAIGAIPLGTMLWWCFAINRHLKMPNALAVTAMLMFTSFLVLLAAVYLLVPEWLFDHVL